MNRFAKPVAWWVVGGILATVSVAAAADYQLITSVAAIYEYNDNIRLHSKDELSDSIYTIAPKLELVREGERFTARADASAAFYQYQDYDEFDDIDQWYNGYLQYRPTERWEVAVEGHASDDNRPDRVIEDTGLVLSNIRRKRFEGNATVSRTFSEVTTGGVYVDANREDFDDPETSDRKDYHAVLFVNRSLDPWIQRTTGRMHLGYSHFAFDREYERTGSTGGVAIDDRYTDAVDVDYYSLTVGTETALTETLTLTADLGGRYAQSERTLELRRTYGPPIDGISLQETDSDNDGWGAVGSAELKYQGEGRSCTLLLSHDLQPTTGESGTANRTTVRLSASARLLERLRAHIAFQWHQNRNDQNDASQDHIDTMAWNARGGLTWEMNDYFALKGEYAYTIYEDRDVDTTAYRNKVLVQLEARHDWLE